MKKRIDYNKNILLHLTEGQQCRRCNRKYAKPISAEELGICYKVLFYHVDCDNYQVTLFNKGPYLKACFELGIDRYTLAPIDETQDLPGSDNASNRP